MNGSNRRTIVILLLLAMVWVMIPGYGYTAAEEEAEVEETLSKADGETLSEAAEAALEERGGSADRTGKNVVGEVLEKRTRNSKHYLLEDGTYQATISLHDVHYADENGKYFEIDTKLVDEGDVDVLDVPLSAEVAGEVRQIQDRNRHLRTSGGIDTSDTRYRVLQAPYDARLAKQFSGGYTVGKGSASLHFVPEDAESVTGSVYHNSMIYYDAWEDTDVKLEMLQDSVKETIIVNSSSAPTTFVYEVQGELSDDFRAGEMRILPAWYVDADGVLGDVEQTIVRKDGKTTIEIKLDHSNLSYPVRIDPTVSFNTTLDTYTVDNQVGLNRHTSQTNPVGYNSESNGQRSYLKFDLSSIQNAVGITSASMNLYFLSAGSAYYGQTGSVSVHVLRATSDWNESVQYYNAPSVSTSDASNRISFGTSTPKNQWREFDIIAMIQNMIQNSLPNYGFVLDYYSASSYSTASFASKERNSGVLAPYISVTYNGAPSAPTVQQPNGGETIDTTYTITWLASTDDYTTQSNLKYHIQLSTNNGSSWSDILALSGSGVTSHSHNFASVAQTTTGLVRVRAYDGTQYGPWDPSNAPFTIKHNTAPTAPTIVSPNGTSGSPTPALPTPTLQWTFNDPDAGDTQSQYRVIVYNGTTSVRDTAWVASGSSSYTVPSGVLSRGVTYNWKVATKDNKGAESPYSALRYFRTNVLPVATMTSYTNGQQVNDNVLTFTWTYSDTEAQPQTQFQVVGSKDNWATYAYDSGIVNSAATSHTTTPLSNGTWKFRVRVKDNLEWSAWANRDNLTLPNAFEPNETSGTAFPILYANTYTSNISTASDVDWYRYTAAQTGIDRVTLTVPAGLNYDVTVYDASLNEVGFGMRGAGKTESVLYPVTGGHIYSIKLTGNGQFSTSAGYGLTAERLLLQFNTTYTFDNNGNLQSKSTVQQP